MPLNDGTETAELHESNAFEIQSLRTTYKAALELIEELDVTVAESLEALERIAELSPDQWDTDYIVPLVQKISKEAIRKAKEQ